MGSEPSPKQGKKLVWPVAKHFIERTMNSQLKAGSRKYGTPLYTHNGRDAGQDALEEYVDLGQYLTQLIMEHRDVKIFLANVCSKNPDIAMEAHNAGLNLNYAD